MKIVHSLLLTSTGEFVPVLIQNNTYEGRDREICDEFGEKQKWANPVIRITDPDKQDLTKRVEGYFAKAATKMRMKKAMSVWKDRLNKQGNNPGKEKKRADEMANKRKALGI